MKCPKCGTDNIETRSFCREYGAKLSLICAQCGLENLPEDKFCGKCGTKVRATGSESTREKVASNQENAPAPTVFADEQP